MNDEAPRLQVLTGRYVLGEVIGRGGAATVHLGKPIGEGRRGVVAIKRLHPHLAADPAFLAMMLDEARLMSRVRQPNVVATLDVVMEGGELYIVMEYVHGVTLGALLGRAYSRKERAPVAVACAIVRDALLGLDAAHEAKGASAEPLGMVHRDVSPQNLLVAESGVLKVVDFGIAKAEGRVGHTVDGSIKGKLGYMAPEQLFGEALDRRADVYSAGVVLWETLVGERLFAGHDGGSALAASLVSHVSAPGERVPGVDPRLDRVVLRALAHDREQRFATARAMLDALCEAQAPASAEVVAAWVRSLAGDVLDERGARLFVFDQASRELIADLPRPRDSLVSMGTGATASGAGGSRGRGRGWPFAVVAALCAAAGGAAAVVLGGPGENVSAAPAASGTSAASGAGEVGVSDAAAESDAATSAGVGAEPAASATVTASATATVSATVTASTSAMVNEPGSKAGATRPAKGTPSKPTPKADGCDPPFTIDAQGHKRYKRDCLR